MTEPGVNRCDVVVAGGGLVGRALALSLARFAPKSLRIVLLDPSPRATDQRASALAAGSRRLLETLGLWQALEAEARPILAFDITDSALDAVWRSDFLSFESEDTGPSAWMVENARLAALLGDRVAAEPGIRVVGAEAQGFTAGPHGIAIRLGTGETLTGRLLVAADGRRSRLRAEAGIKCVRFSYPQVGIVTTVAHERPHEGRATQHFLPAGPFAILPLTGNRASLVWTEARDAGRAIMGLDDAGFLAELARRFGRQLGAISLAGPRQSYPLETHLARSLIAPRLALVGDAARGLHPLAGQGLNAGFRDVAALAEVVTDAARLGLDIGALPVLTRYERWRRFDGASAALAMDAMNRLFSNDHGPLRLVRDVGLGLVARAPRLKRMLMAEAAGAAGELPRLLKGEAP